ncbi:polysaccharide biosynthesis/export family protein [Coralloluteibacterium stylophorae]|uniref:Polysaccharide biosynthesis/export family protein n=1 Tax=Coralloluteibacterium stylophorae TaxID=1776034 RepID=A0A8J8AXG6_9GAMM|nr:polysaccharide biosynthesis/export family protein [Coralloluteibacterium stylophorae]MBS7458538.1 polysaccharide biosynthesis/export family protein [Coralloluteibacterium stylophorae]
MTALRRLVPALVALLLAATAAAQETRVVARDDGRFPAPDSIATSGAYTGTSDYRLGPLDLIEISVFQVPDISREVRINSSGNVSLPLIGVVAAGGRTIQELEAEIAAKLQEGYLQSPQVSVFVKEYTSQRVTVEGAVNKPGIFPITGRTTLLQAVALAEGMDELADPEAVVVFRVIDGRKHAALFDLTEIRRGTAPDPEIYGDDIVVVDKSGSRSFVKALTDTLRGFIGFKPY